MSCVIYPFFPQHCLYFLPLLQGQGSLRPTFGPVRMGLFFSMAAAASLTMSLGLPGELAVAVLPPLPKVAVDGCSVRWGMLRRKLSKAIRLDALRKMLWQISLLMPTIRSSNILNASALYSMSGSRWP